MPYRPIPDKEDLLLEAVRAGFQTYKQIEDSVGLSRTTVHRIVEKDRRFIKKTASGVVFIYEATLPAIPSAEKDPTIEKAEAVAKRLLSLTKCPEDFSDLEWLLDYVEKLEAENQSLYRQLCNLTSLSQRASSIRRRYEDRLAAIIETSK